VELYIHSPYAFMAGGLFKHRGNLPPCTFLHWLSFLHGSPRLRVDKMRGNSEEQIFGAYFIKAVEFHWLKYVLPAEL
jgi:hypothetical protein